MCNIICLALESMSPTTSSGRRPGEDVSAGIAFGS